MLERFSSSLKGLSVNDTELFVDNLLELWPDLSEDERLKAFEALPRDKADDFFLELSSWHQCELLLQMPAGERRIWLRLLAPDDAADVIQVASEDEREALLNYLDPYWRDAKLLLCWLTKKTRPEG